MRTRKILTVAIGVILVTTFVLAGCSVSSKPQGEVGDEITAPDAGMEEMDHDEMEDGHDTAVRQFVPNDGAEVKITSPANEATFAPDANIPVTIETINFNIGEEGNHWHIYLDGNPTMVMGGNTFVLQNLSPGHHEIEVFLSLGTHEDLEQGDSVTIMVAE